MKQPEALLATAASLLEANGTPYALIGGCARNAYAPPRATRDVDFAVAVDSAQLAALVSSFLASGFKPATSVTAEVGDSVPDLILFRNGQGERIDVLIAKTAFETQALSRATRRPVPGYETIPIVTVEDLLVYKLLAGRPRDMADAEEVARSQQRAGVVIDWDYVTGHCVDWGVEARLQTVKRLVDQGS